MRTDVSKALSTCKLCALCHYTNNLSVLFHFCCFLIFKDSTNDTRLELSQMQELCSWTPTTSSPLKLIGVLRGCTACCSVNGRERQGEYEGEGGEGRARERDCSVVVYVSLRSCVGRSAPSRHCCCCEKERTKDSPCCGPLIPLPAQLCHDHTLMECSWN